MSGNWTWDGAEATEGVLTTTAPSVQTQQYTASYSAPVFDNLRHLRNVCENLHERIRKLEVELGAYQRRSAVLIAPPGYDFDQIRHMQEALEGWLLVGGAIAFPAGSKLTIYGADGCEIVAEGGEVLGEGERKITFAKP